jgi:hypothetical protein
MEWGEREGLPAQCIHPCLINPTHADLPEQLWGRGRWGEVALLFNTIGETTCMRKNTHSKRVLASCSTMCSIFRPSESRQHASDKLSGMDAWAALCTT